MILIILILMYACAFLMVVGLFPVQWESRPTLGMMSTVEKKENKKQSVRHLFRMLAMLNKPICTARLRKRFSKSLSLARVDLIPEEYILVKELLSFFLLFFSYPAVAPDMIPIWLVLGSVSGHILTEFWLGAKIKKIKATLVRELPDAIDLLGLCVNAGLDFMLSLKWVVEKSPPTVMVEELNTVLQEINVGKTRRDAIKDFAGRYDLPDLSTFARTLIQADKMGTSVTEALNILSEDMRLARYRRGEQIALKAPMKMLVPLLLFIFPVVAILVAGPILLDFMQNNPFQGLAR